MRLRHGLRPVVAFCFLLGGPKVSLAEDLQRELRQLDSLRKGRETPLAVVDQRGEELLRKYPDPKGQGQIYYQLAHIHAQSGLTRPERVVEYAKKALGYPLEPSQRMRLFVYWGDALRVGNPKEPFPANRRSATAPYLEGLKELLKDKLPDKAPELPPVFAYQVDGPEAEVERVREQHKKAVAARKQAEQLGEMVKHRDVLVGQIAGMYGRKPFATEEVSELAREALGDSPEYDRLMRSVQAEVAKRAGDPEPVGGPTPRQEDPGGHWYYIAAAAVIAAVAVGLLVFLHRRRGRAGK